MHINNKWMFPPWSQNNNYCGCSCSITSSDAGLSRNSLRKQLKCFINRRALKVKQNKEGLRRRLTRLGPNLGS